MYDLVVIGGGSGGVRAARMAASYGAKVAIVEEYRYGGTCVIRGCVPKKHFVHASRFPELFEVAPAYGWTINAKFDWPTLKANKDTEIARLEGIYEKLLGNANVEIFHDRGIVDGPNAVRLKKEGRVLETRHILVATGGTPFVPDIPGAKFGITSNEAFNLETPAQIDPDRGRRLCGGRVCRHLRRARRQNDPELSARQRLARFRRRPAQGPARGHGAARRDLPVRDHYRTSGPRGWRGAGAVSPPATARPSAL